MKIERITPVVAKGLLDNVTANRRLDPRTVDNYAPNILDRKK